MFIWTFSFRVFKLLHFLNLIIFQILDDFFTQMVVWLLSLDLFFMTYNLTKSIENYQGWKCLFMLLFIQEKIEYLAHVDLWQDKLDVSISRMSQMRLFKPIWKL
jgi:hypothetical protein